MRHCHVGDQFSLIFSQIKELSPSHVLGFFIVRGISPVEYRFLLPVNCPVRILSVIKMQVCKFTWPKKIRIQVPTCIFFRGHFADRSTRGHDFQLSHILCVGGKNSKGFYLIKISTHQIIKNIVGPQIIYSIYECIDGLFLCSIKNENGNYSLVKYKYDNQDLKTINEKEKAHGGNIYKCVELNDGTIISGGSDNLIKLWRN